MEQKDSSFEQAQLRWSEANAPQLIRDRIMNGELLDPLYRQRMKAIEEELGVRPSFVTDEEDAILKEMKRLLQQLSQALVDKSHFTDVIEPCCKQILKRMHRYVFFRMEAVLTNLDPIIAHFYPNETTQSVILYTHPVIGDYKIHQTFPLYCAEVRQSVSVYRSSKEFSTLVSCIERYAPLLLSKPLTLTEFFQKTRSHLCCPQTKFFSPPHLSELCVVASALDSIFSSKGETNLSDAQDGLNALVDRLIREEQIQNISTILSKVIGSVEALAYVTPNDINGNTEIFIRQCLFMGMAITEYIQYDIMSVSPDTVRKAQGVLANQSSTGLQKISATRLILYSKMPWYLLRNIGLLQFYMDTTKLNRPIMRKIQFDSIIELSKDYQKLLPSLYFLLFFEIEASKGNNIELPLHVLISHSLPTLTLFGNYGADIVFSLKISNTLKPIKWGMPLEPNALLRIFGILGECGKNLSDEFIRLTNVDLWSNIRKLRDLIAHKKSIELKIVRILEQDPNFCLKVQRDLRKLLYSVDAFLYSEVNNRVGISQLYARSDCTVGSAIEELYNKSSMRLLPADKQELLATADSQPIELEKKRDILLSILKGEVPANQVEQAEIISMLKSFYKLSKKLRGDIMECYKRLRASKPSKFTPRLQTALESIQTEPKDTYLKKVSDLIDRLPEYLTPASLTTALEEIGLVSVNTLWENKRLHCLKSTPQENSNEDKNPYELAESATNALLTHLEKLDQLTATYRGDLNQFWSNHVLCLGAEHHFVMIRQYAQNIQEAMGLIENFKLLDPRQVALNTLCQLVDDSLYSLRMYGNSFAHLHDMINFHDMSLTPHGNRMQLWQRIVALLDGTQLQSSENPIIFASIRANITTALEELKKRIKLADPQTQNPQRFYLPTEAPVAQNVINANSNNVTTSQNSNNGAH